MCGEPGCEERDRDPKVTRRREERQGLRATDPVVWRCLGLGLGARLGLELGLG